nr:AAA family ATPase [Kribbella sindirgiensis]
MRLRSFEVRNFRRLRDVRVALTPGTTVLVGANNSGKTSAMHVIQLFTNLLPPKFTVHDFSADCWAAFNSFDPTDQSAVLPAITLDLWFDVDDQNLHRVIDLLPDLSWTPADQVGIRLAYEPKDGADLHAKYTAATGGIDTAGGHWPKSLYDYLRRRLTAEYHVVYYKLGASHTGSTTDERSSTESCASARSTPSVTCRTPSSADATRTCRRPWAGSTSDTSTSRCPTPMHYVR